MSIDTSILPPPAEAPFQRASKTSVPGRALALIALLAVLAGGAVVAHIAYRTLTDAWIAPLRLSPDNEKVVALRVQQTKERVEPIATGK